MKRDKIIYWTTTSLLTLGLASAGFSYLASHRMDDAFRHFGVPDYFKTELGVAKIISAFVLILPSMPHQVKGWAYAGVFIVFVSAFFAHLSVDGISTTLQPVFALSLWAVSVYFFNRIKPAVSASGN